MTHLPQDFATRVRFQDDEPVQPDRAELDLYDWPEARITRRTRALAALDRACASPGGTMLLVAGAVFCAVYAWVLL